MRTKPLLSLRMLALLAVLVLGAVTWSGCQGVETQFGTPPGGDEGWCCAHDDVFPCSEVECYQEDGEFFPTEHEAAAHCEGQMPAEQPMPGDEGWCCAHDDVFPCPEHECYDEGGDFFPTEQQAVAQCEGQVPGDEGWCCDAGNVMPCSEDECHSWGGDFFPTEQQAVAHCGGQMPPDEGWCCDAGNVSPCSEDECHSWGGVFFLAEADAIAHCQGSAPGPSPGGKPIINYFTANPSSITAGQSSTLKWDVSNADSVQLSHGWGKVGAMGQIQVSPTVTHVYQLTATNSAGTATATAKVDIWGTQVTGVLPMISYFRVNPSTIAVSVGAAKLEWNVSGATNVTISESAVFANNTSAKTPPANVNATGSWTLTPSKVGYYEYTLSATNSAGTVTDTVKLTVGP